GPSHVCRLDRRGTAFGDRRLRGCGCSSRTGTAWRSEWWTAGAMGVHPGRTRACRRTRGTAVAVGGLQHRRRCLPGRPPLVAVAGVRRRGPQGQAGPGRGLRDDAVLLLGRVLLPPRRGGAVRRGG